MLHSAWPHFLGGVSSISRDGDNAQGCLMRPRRRTLWSAAGCVSTMAPAGTLGDHRRRFRRRRQHRRGLASELMRTTEYWSSSLMTLDLAASVSNTIPSSSGGRTPRTDLITAKTEARALPISRPATSTSGVGRRLPNAARRLGSLAATYR